ncbi:hypothetical protein Q4534_15255 [Cyclobacterium sp. 1_MG-2023]|uniref:hypothetical protein n=1 Tax=Cyclobacterium sp. 1_MG-2023 TaxID=3062681 RepID=UPI0026E125ED|nr:hypothetical protein [Cyclobacterium sp. 1_MG-2023]MDO6438780.1 hypothetical protein [Cyclobacterium sp. 1_MG-2023]
MNRKLFPLDKNYILRQAQEAVEKEMMQMMVDELKKAFTLLFNPLELQDDTYLKILSVKSFPDEHLSIIYRQLAGIYRYKFGSNQLELRFDGKSHFEKYQEDWKQTLQKWVQTLGQDPAYVKNLLRMTLLYDTPSRALFAENRCKSLLNEHFGLLIIKRKGDLLMKLGS